MAQVANAGESIFRDGTETLEYSLSLLGHGHRSSLQSWAEEMATGQRRATPRGARLLRVRSPQSAGIAVLEETLLAQPELEGRQAFGVVVHQVSANEMEALVLLQGGRR